MSTIQESALQSPAAKKIAKVSTVVMPLKTE